MNETLIALIDEQISKLQQVRSLIVESAPAPKRGRPGRSTAAAGASAKAAVTAPKRVMSAEGKARIAAAQKKRWAAARKAAK